MAKYGIDVSQWQRDINWSEVKTDFAILRAGYGRIASQVDTKFERNYLGAKAADIPVGAYWYSYAKSAEEARQEAKVFIDVLKYKQFEYPVYFDVEEKATLDLGRDKVSEIIIAFLDEMEKAGYFAGLYMSASFLTNYTTQYIKDRYAIWVAHYDVNKPNYTGQYGMWQKTSTGKVSGIKGNVDLNECYVDYPKQIKADGRNNFQKPKPEPVPESNKLTGELKLSDGTIYKVTLEKQ